MKIGKFMHPAGQNSSVTPKSYKYSTFNPPQNHNNKLPYDVKLKIITNLV